MPLDTNQPPRDFRALRDRILDARASLPRRLAAVADYAIEAPDDIALGTAAGVAARAGVQPSTLVRFAKALGFTGFSDMQTVFQDRLRDRPSNYDERLRSLASHADGASMAAALIDGFAAAAVRSVEGLRARLDPERLAAAAARLGNAETIYLIAQRRAYPVVAYMAYAFAKMGIRAVLAGSGQGIDRETLAFAGPADAALAVSFAPYAPQTLELTAQVAAQGTPLVVITDSPFSPLIAAGSLAFELAEADFEGFRSLSASMTLAMALTVATAEARRLGDQVGGVPLSARTSPAR